MASTKAASRSSKSPRVRFALHRGASVNEQDWTISRPRMRRLIAASLPADCASAEFTIAMVNESEGRSMNRQFRRQNHATNILTFAYQGRPDVRADLVLCLAVIRREARTQRKPLEHHLMHLLVHGVLHACGWDHMRSREAQQMEALETAILRRFRIPDPYATSA